MHRGSCMCGHVRFEVDGKLGDVEYCHCIQCRRWTSHFLASTESRQADLKLQHPERVTWYRSSEKARRGFCAKCGSPLFFDPMDKAKHDWIGISMGALDLPTGVKGSLHIFTAEKGDYYEINDGLPQNEH